MNLKEELISLIEIVQKVTKKTQKEISVLAGYKEKHLSQTISADKVSERLVKNFKKTFAAELSKEYAVSKSESRLLTDLLQVQAWVNTFIPEVAAFKAFLEKLHPDEARRRLDKLSSENLIILAREFEQIEQ